MKFLISQPFSGHANIVRILGQRHNALIIAPPTPEQILNQDLSWFDQFTPNQFWVLPELEHCFLRHANGLKLLRSLLTLATQGQLGRGVIACDSWAWAFFQRIHAWPTIQALTLQAFDSQRLAKMITTFAKHSKMHIHFYNAKNGHEMLLEDKGSASSETEFNELAAYCRGNLALALHYWQERLCNEPEETQSQNGAAENTQSTTEPKSTEQSTGKNLWLAKMPAEPSMPTGNPEAFFLVLHVLLIHNGLDEIGLENVLPYSQTRCQGLLAQLEQALTFTLMTRLRSWYLKNLGVPIIDLKPIRSTLPNNFVLSPI
ncbi:hypothetical protein [Thiomicrospira sp. ALE5]|uniref:hypothetical protein n=1 Tax=Thiomicrospira sp. ALE5 TaxID=748650 RepID=UPI000B8976AE|nr:hypothetical protein [Thiomicrospira sp. ALE5]